MTEVPEARYESDSLLVGHGRFDFKEVGSAAAPLRFEVYMDYECPMSAELFLDVIPQVVTAYVEIGKVKLVHRDFPLPQHPYAGIAARYANAAGVMGQYKMAVEQIFKTQEIWKKDGNIDAQVSRVLTQLTVHRVRELVKYDLDLDKTVTTDLAKGKADHVLQTPTVVLVSKGKRKVIMGDLNVKLLRTDLDDLLSRQ